MFCSKCGNSFPDGSRVCPSCGAAIEGAHSHPAPSNDIDYFERGKLIYPDCIVSKSGDNAPEYSVRQYNLAKLRTWYRFDKAEGRLQITNKRVLFRATGQSLYGKTVVENEFAIEEIGGLEIRKGTVFNKAFFIICLVAFIAMAVISVGSSVMNSLSRSMFGYGGSGDESINVFVVLLVLILIAVSITTVLSSKLRGLKVITAFAAWALSSKSPELMIASCLITVVAVCMFINRPNLVVIIKSKGAMTGIDIRRSSGTEHNEFTGFDEVLPWDDSEAAIRELGAIINDIKAVGILAVSKWQDEQSRARTPVNESNVTNV